MESFLDQPHPDTSFASLGSLTDDKDMGYDEWHGEELGPIVEVLDEDALAKDGYPIDPDRDRRHAHIVCSTFKSEKGLLASGLFWLADYMDIVNRQFPGVTLSEFVAKARSIVGDPKSSSWEVSEAISFLNKHKNTL